MSEMQTYKMPWDQMQNDAVSGPALSSLTTFLIFMLPLLRLSLSRPICVHDDKVFHNQKHVSEEHF